MQIEIGLFIGILISSIISLVNCGKKKNQNAASSSVVTAREMAVKTPIEYKEPAKKVEKPKVEVKKDASQNKEVEKKPSTTRIEEENQKPPVAIVAQEKDQGKAPELKPLTAPAPQTVVPSMAIAPPYPEPPAEKVEKVSEKVPEKVPDTVLQPLKGPTPSNPSLLKPKESEPEVVPAPLGAKQSTTVPKPDDPTKPHIVTEPPTDMVFNASVTSQTKLVLRNIHDKKVMFKIKLSDNAVFQVNPVFGAIEPGKTFELTITHIKSTPKEVKLVIVNSVLTGSDKDVANLFKTLTKPTGAQVTVKLVAK